MVQFFQQAADTRQQSLAEALGMGASQIGQGIAAQKQLQQQQQQQSGLAQGLFGDQAEQFKALSPDQQITLKGQMQKQLLAEQKQLREQQEAPLLAKLQNEGSLTPEELSQLSPTSLRSLIGQPKPTFEPTEEKLEAERVSKLATEIEDDYRIFQNEEQRLGGMEKLSDRDQLTSPLVVKALEHFGLPLSTLNSPDSEEYVKLEADFLRDVNKVFPGGKVTEYQTKAYLKTIPSLLNSKEGREAIVRNRKLQNEGKQLRYNAYKDILKENGGRKPRNLGLLIDEKIGGRMAAIENEFKDGLQKETEKTQEPISMRDPSGKVYQIPPNLIEQALKDGLAF